MFALFLLVVTIWLGALFLYTAGMKLVRYRASASGLVHYRLGPPRLALLAGVALPWAEVVCAALILSGSVFGPLLGLLLGVAFTTTSATVLARRITTPPCGCAGGSERVGRMTLCRAIAVAGGSGLLLISMVAGSDPELPAALVLAVVSAACCPALVAGIRSVRYHVAARAARRIELAAIRKSEDLLRMEHTTVQDSVARL